jgi:hypothetical protein
MVDYDYCTAAEVQAELQSSTAFSTSTYPSLTTVQQWIYEASDYINNLAGDVFGVTSYTQYVDLNGQEVIQTKHSPIISVTTVEYNVNSLGSTASWETRTAETDYVVYEASGEIALVFANFNPSDGRKRLRVTYKAGYLEVPARVGMLCKKLVADRVLSSLLNSNVNEGTDGGSVSVGSISIVEPGAYGVSNYKRLRDDIDKLKAELLQSTGVYRY